MEIINIAALLLISTLLEHYYNAQNFQITTDVIKYSIREPFCVYVITNKDVISNVLEQTLMELHIPLVRVTGGKLNHSNDLSLIGCDAYVVETKSNHFLTNVFAENAAVFLKPHKRVVIIYNGQEMVDKRLIEYATNIKAVDIIILEGVQDNVYNNMFENKSVNTQNVYIRFLRSTKCLIFPNNTMNTKIKKEDFEDFSWQPKFNYNSLPTFKVSTFNCPPYILYDPHRNVYDGIEYRIIKDLTRNWPIDFRIYTHGTVNASLYASVRNDIVNKVSDISLCSHWQKGLLGSDIDISVPYDQLCLTFLVPKPQMLPRFLFVFEPLSLELWIFILIINVLYAILLHIIALCSKNMKILKHPYLDITLSILDTIHLATSGFPHYFASISYRSYLRIILTLLCVQSLIMITAYSSGFAGILTYPRFRKPIKSFEDMLTHGVHWESSAPEHEDVLRRSLNPTQRQLANMHVGNKSLIQRNERIRKNHNAVVVKALDGGYVTYTESLDEYGRNNLKLLPSCFLTTYIIIPLQKGSPYTHIFNKHLSRVFEQGLVKYWHVQMIKELNVTYMHNFYSSYVEKITAHRGLFTEDVQGIFCLLGIGYAVASLTFIAEILYEKVKCKVPIIVFRTVPF